MKKFLKILRVLGIVLGAIVVIVAAYIIYMLATYHRIEDRQQLEVHAPTGNATLGSVTTGQDYSVMTYNIGFGAYIPEYSFFMDGGKYSWGLSKDQVIDAVNGACGLVNEFDPDFLMMQEIDLDATRSYHVDQYAMTCESFPNYASAYAIDYDSSFMMYPFDHPHGKVKACLCTYSKYDMTSSLRRSLPISESFSKFVDLDRCYSITRIPTSNGKELILIDLHLSAYGNSDAIREGQTNMLVADMEKEYAAGNYVIVGGDFNHDLKADESNTDKTTSWAYPFPRSKLGEHFTFAMDELSSEERDALWNSSRNADIPYDPEKSYTVVLDGFIISDNVTMISYEDINTGYSFSDHDPVIMHFQLNE